MKILILGGGGMLGHKLYQVLSKDHETKAIFRKQKDHYSQFNFFAKNDMIGGIDVTKKDDLIEVLDRESPDIICNAIGKTTRKISSLEHDNVVYLNSYLPQLLNKWCLENSSFLFHFSTDCVYSGQNGPYSANALTDARDLYGLSKILGEIHSSKACLTLRTSIVGREIENHTEFLEWIFANQNDSVFGYKNVFYSGVTTLFLSQVVKKLILAPQRLTGIHQVASPMISKLDLIKKVDSIFNLNIKVQPNFDKVSNKVLDGTPFALISGIKPQSWDEMLNNLKLENDQYENLKEKGDQAA